MRAGVVHRGALRSRCVSYGIRPIRTLLGGLWLIGTPFLQLRDLPAASQG